MSRSIDRESLTHIYKRRVDPDHVGEISSQFCHISKTLPVT